VVGPQQCGLGRAVELTERQGWAVVIATIVLVERRLKRTGRPMLSHVVWRSPVAWLLAMAVAVHLADRRRRLERFDLVSYAGRWL